jgi:predicted permease
VFIPLAMARLAFRDLNSRNIHWLYAFGRLAPGVSRERAEAVINLPFGPLIRDVELPALASGISELERQQFLQRTLVLSDGSRPRARDRAAIRAMALLLLLVTGFVLAIACANVANLLLARVTDRAVEMSVRLSLGASEGRVIRLLLTEVLVLGVVGSAGALAVARLAGYGLLAIMPPGIGMLFDFEINTTMLMFALTVGIVTSLLFGLFPAVHGVRVAAAAGLHTHSSRASGSRAAKRFRTSMATSQVALTTALLGIAGLFVVSLVNVSRVELGIRREGLVTFRVSPSGNGYTTEQARSFFARLEDELRAVPGVSSVTATTVSILSNDSSGNFLTVEGFEATPETDTSARSGRTSVAYFRTLGIPLLAGREFTTADSAASPRVAVVNEAFARKFNLGSRTVGTRMALCRGNRSLDIEIVGLVRDAKYSEVKDPPPAQFYLPYRQADVGSLTFYVRGGTDTRPLVSMIPSVVRRLDANLPIENLRTMDDQIWERTTPDRMLTTLSFAFAGLALVMAAIGVYAVLAYGVAQRLREIGIRMALGAKPRDVRSLVMSQVGRMTLVGGIVGAALALGLGRLGQTMLFGVEGTATGIIGAATLVVVVVALAAGVLPARRATSVNPIEALRVE